MAGHRSLLAFSALLLLCAVAEAQWFKSPFDKTLGFDEPPGTLRGAYSYTLCAPDAVAEPASTDELAAAVRHFAAAAAAANKTVRIRVTQRLFHSSAAFTCPAQAAAPPPSGEPAAGPRGVLAVNIVQSNMARVLAVDKPKLQMRVQPGIHLWALTQEAHAAGMTVPLGSIPVFGSLTLGGVIAAGAHGSGGGPGAADTPMAMVREVVWVDAAGGRRVATPASAEWRAFYSGLGLVGVMAELLLQLAPPSHTAFKTLFHVPDTNIVRDLERYLREDSSSVLLMWRPDQARYTVNLINEVDTSVPLTDPELVTTILPDFRNEAPVGGLNRINDADIRDDYFPIVNNLVGYYVQRRTLDRGYAGKPNGSMATPLAGVGLTSRLVTTAPCGENCAYNGVQTKSTVYDTEFTLDFSHLQAWVDDVKRIIQKDLFRDGATSARNLGMGFICLRVGGSRDDLLATQHGLARPVFVQSTWLRSREIFQHPMRYGYVQDLIELLGLAKYNMSARPHWGKNTDRTFTHPSFPIRPRYPSFDALLSLQAAHDPGRVFEPPLFTKVKERRPYAPYPGCALDFQCFCTEDAHCNAAGDARFGSHFRCVPSAAFPEFRVCKGPADWNAALTARYGGGDWVQRKDVSKVMDALGGAAAPLMANPLTAQLLRLAAAALPVG
ncbi:MAG: hypothetical protein J3K34DRAFT_517181 [Monoraphidium minutum]|nr:MAG: hypothetical protein J3K34DRAFT_517181 [Monoraphidium minutum]